MSEVVKLRTRAEIDEEAATWIWRMEGAAAGNADPEGFEAWLRQDPRHRRAVDELTKVWEALDGLADSQPAHQPATPTIPRPPETSPPRIRLGRSLWLAAAAAALIAAVGATLWLTKSAETQVLATAVGQHRNAALADGTVVALNTNTIVETNIGRHSREIHLRKGEAHFDVAPDRSRPFLVFAGDAVVRAVGTEFEVRVRNDRHVDVLVNEGRVEVQPDTAALELSADPAPDGTATTALTAAGSQTPNSVTRARIRAVGAGETLSTATTDYAVIPVTPERLSSELAWREGAVVFDSEPLAAAITEIQRYTDSRIVIADPAIATLPVGGRFKTDDLQGFLDGLEAALPVTIRRTPDGIVYVDARQSATGRQDLRGGR